MSNTIPVEPSWTANFNNDFKRYEEAFAKATSSYSGIGNLQPLPNSFKLFCGENADFSFPGMEIAMCKFRGYREVDAWKVYPVLYKYCEMNASGQSNDFFDNIVKALKNKNTSKVIMDMISTFGKSVEYNGIPIEINNASEFLPAIAQLLPVMQDGEPNFEALAQTLHLGIKVYSDAKPFVAFKEYNETAPIKIEFQMVPKKNTKLLLLYSGQGIGEKALEKLYTPDYIASLQNYNEVVKTAIFTNYKNISQDIEMLSMLRSYEN